jgi:protocatechuate 3,4-dioxygenase beta subunit
MRAAPQPEQTPNGPAFEGRPLDRADEDVVDEGAAFDIRTLVSRRRLLGLVGLGVGAATLAACAPLVSRAAPTSTATPSAGTTDAPTPTTTATGVPAGEIPQETAGPYPGDGSNGPDILERSGIVRSDIRTSLDGGATAVGVPMTLALTILDMASGDTPFAGVAVNAWHCDAQGGYSMYSEGIENETYLRGVQVADPNGIVRFTSVMPACYDGRWPHIHFEVYPDAASITDSATAIATSQVALPEDACAAVYRVSLESDGVFGDDGGALELATVTGDVGSGYTVALSVRVDTTTSATAGSVGGGPGGRP